MANTRQGVFLRAFAACCAAAFAGNASAGSFDLFGISTEYKLTLGYAAAMRMEGQRQGLINGPIDVQLVTLSTDPTACPGLMAIPPVPCLGSFGHTGLPITTNFDDANRNFRKHALLNNRVSAYGEALIKLDSLGYGDIGAAFSGAAHYDQVFLTSTDHDNPDSVNQHLPIVGGERTGNLQEWTKEAEETNGKRRRLLEAYVYGQWYLTDTVGLSVRAGKHLAAWGESLFFPGIVSAQGPFDATKAAVPGVEVKEILLPVNQISLQMSLTSDLTLLAYNQFDYGITEIFPEGDFFSPADLVGPGATFGYGSINPLHEDWCSDTSRVQVTNDTSGSGQGLCQAGAITEHEPRYIMTYRTPDQLPDEEDEKRQYGVGLKYSILPDLNVGAYYLRYNNHNPGVRLNMGYARVGDATGSCAAEGDPNCTVITTEQFNVRVPTSYTVTYANDIEMKAISFSTVFWVFNIGGEVIRRENVDTSVEAVISGVTAPVGTRGQTTTAQMSLLYVNNPDFLMYDEVVMVGEFGYTQVDKVEPRKNEDGICYTDETPNDNNLPDDCTGNDSDPYSDYGNRLFYSKDSSAGQLLILPKGRNVFAGWDVGTPINFAWLFEGTPSTPGVFGALYGKGDKRFGVGVTAQYLQNLEVSLNYNIFRGSANRHIGRSTLKANPYADHDYLALSIKYNL